MEFAPWDEHNQQLAEHSHPADWRNPSPQGRYSLVAIGGGAAGIAAALNASLLGGRAALLERRLLGGNYLHDGCIPSMALLRSARAVYQSSLGQEFGFALAGRSEVDFAAVMRRMRRLRAQISHRDSAQRIAVMGVDVHFGQARFTSPKSLEIDGQSIEFCRAVIATGSRPAAAELPGLDDVGYANSETILSLASLPRRLIVLGAGPAGCELAQAFSRLGSEVHLVNRSPRILGKEDPEAARIIQRQFQREGIHLHLGWRTTLAEKAGALKSLVIERQGERKKLIADEILVAWGRRANVEGLGLEAAGIAANDRGVEVNDRLQTANPAVFAAGDVCSLQRYTPSAEALARLCVRNALLPPPLNRQRMSGLVIPRCTYTDPELAQVGLTAAEATSAGLRIDTYRTDLSHVDRALIDGEEQGFVMVHARAGTGRVVGATVVASHAGELIGLLALLMTKRTSLSALSRTILCYPTQSGALRAAAEAYQRTRLTPGLAGLLRRWMAWRR